MQARLLRQPELKAPPADVVEDIDPTSARNPFRCEGLRWRNYLHQALPVLFSATWTTTMEGNTNRLHDDKVTPTIAGTLALALQNLRVFGWTKDSETLRHYARAYSRIG